MFAPEMKTQSLSGSRGRAQVRISNLPPWLSILCMVIYIKEEQTIQISVSSTLTVYHDGQFWVGLAEHVEGGRYGVARIVFGEEPSDADGFVLYVLWVQLAHDDFVRCDLGTAFEWDHGLAVLLQLPGARGRQRNSVVELERRLHVYEDRLGRAGGVSDGSISLISPLTLRSVGI